MFYFVHGTTLNNFKNILKDKYIFSNKYLLKEYIRMFYEDKPYIFTNILFDDINLKNNEDTPFGNIGIILNKKIIKEYKIILNLGWLSCMNSNSIIINKNEVEKKILLFKNLLKKQLENSKSPYILNNEVIFEDKIPLDDYMIGIICSKEIENEVLNELKYYKYDDISIFNNFLKILKNNC